MSTPTPYTLPTPRQRNAHLLPQNKHDEKAISHLSTLDPSEWTHLILIPYPTTVPPTPTIDTATGLLPWLQDINWPIAKPTATLLLTLVNDPSRRKFYGHALAKALNALLAESEDWAWCYWVLVHVVLEMDREWMRRVLEGGLRGFRERVPGEEERGWEFGMVVAECLGEEV